MESRGSSQDTKPLIEQVLLSPDILSILTQFTATHDLDATCRALHKVHYEVGLFRLNAFTTSSFLKFAHIRNRISLRSRNPIKSIFLSCGFDDTESIEDCSDGLQQAHVWRLHLTVREPSCQMFRYMSGVIELTIQCINMGDLEILRPLVQLERLTVAANISSLTGLDSCSKLKHLDTTECKLLPDSAFVQFAQTHQTLESLAVYCGDWSSLDVFKKFSNLRTLTLRQAGNC
jgi:hypothetical protein